MMTKIPTAIHRICNVYGKSTIEKYRYMRSKTRGRRCGKYAADVVDAVFSQTTADGTAKLFKPWHANSRNGKV